MVLSHASEEGAVADTKTPTGGGLMGNLKSMLAKPKDKVA